MPDLGLLPKHLSMSARAMPTQKRPRDLENWEVAGKPHKLQDSLLKWTYSCSTTKLRNIFCSA